ncbi:MAG: hypothetical protein IJW03_02190 [Clostridia bacterium]|nr:hypothetical protein [Clostridia bacterium]
MLDKVITVDFDKKCGKIKPLHCINGGPRSGGYKLPYDFSEEFTELGIPFVRTNTASGEYGLNQFINIHCIFPDFSADETLEESYNFLPTDLYLASIRNTGADIFFRLGESSEPYSRKLYARCPADIEKWARICEHVIMHYNEGWANGFKLNIKYFEVWNAADSSEGFAGEPREFYELYRVVANHLRERFPKIRIGAYGARGFYSLNRLDATEEMKTYVPFMQQFFSYITAEATAAPLDFFTWSCYTSNPEELAMHIKYARTYLDSAGLRRTRSIICEYNSSKSTQMPNALRPEFATELASALILAQKNPVDMMMYSTSDISAADNGLFSLDDHTTHRHYAAYGVMRSFAKLYKLGTPTETEDYRKELYSLAAMGQSEAGILLVTRAHSGKVKIMLKNCAFDTCSIVKTVPGGERGAGTDYKAENVTISGGKIIFPAGKNEIYYIRLFNKQ